MRSLFVRILLWFGLAMITAAVASFVIGVIAERQARDLAPPHLVQALGIYSQTAADMMDRETPATVDAYFDRIESVTGVHAYLIDDNGNEVTSETLPPGAAELAQRARQKMGMVNDLTHGVPLNAVAVRSPRGEVYVLVAEDNAFRRGSFSAIFGRPGSFRFALLPLSRTLLPILLVGGVFCYWLARYLSKPMENLRSVAQELAGGNLAARVDDKLLKRRDEIGHLGRDFNVMATRIESLVQAQRRLLGDISHELRSPLARQGVALGLARRRAGAGAMTALDRIEREGERLNEMIGQLLTLTRLESGTDGFEHVQVELGELLKEVAEDADYEARDRHRSVRIVRQEAAAIPAVPEMIRSAIENVVRNAVRHTAEGTSVELSLASEAVNGHRAAVVTVRDHGKGVPENAIEEIFRPFYRVEDDRDRKTGGAGLGLSIAARAVRLHRGTIRATNEKDGGLMVEIRLPAEQS